MDTDSNAASGAAPGGAADVPQSEADVEAATLASESELPTDGGPEADARVMELLSEKVPLSLIIDLSAPAGPDSEQILDDEGEPDDPWWEPIA